MQLKDVTPIIKAILEERDKIPRIIDKERYIPNPQPYHDGDCMRGGIRKALRIIEQAPVVDAMPRWISVADALPKFGDRHDVLCVVKHKDPTCKGYHVGIYEYDARFVKEGIGPVFDLSDWSNAEYLYVSHWMPLPEPPKEDN